MGNKTTHSTYTPVTGLHGPTGSPGIEAPGDAVLPPEILRDGGLVGRAGRSLENDQGVASEKMVINALQTVYDTEIPVNIYDLGLIYKLEIANSGNVRIEMTLNALGCPVAGVLPQQVAEAAASIDGIGEVEVYLVWEPIWDMANISEDAKLALGLF